MFEIAIVGGGLSGLSLARRLNKENADFHIFEARNRLGGRILSATNPHSGLTADLGPAWFWPDIQPNVVALVKELNLEEFPQYDEGKVMHLADADKSPDVLSADPVHNGARRLDGGMAHLIDAVCEQIPRDRIHLEYRLTKLRDEGEFISLTFEADNRAVEISAQTVVLAVPPRLIEEQLEFFPPLNEATREAMYEAGTWMASEAKVVIGYVRPYWREKKQSGSAFVTHEQATLAEIFDACDKAGSKAALAGFVALSPARRREFAAGLPMLMDNQMTQLFGPELQAQDQQYQNWADEPYTCAKRDLEAPRTSSQAGMANPLLQRTLWTDKLYLGASETAAKGAGYLEGALNASARIAADIIAKRLEKDGVGNGSKSVQSSSEYLSKNAESIAIFSAWVADQAEPAFDTYRLCLNQNLQSQQRDQLTQRAILESLEQVFHNALSVLESLSFDREGINVERGRSSLTPLIQEPFRKFLQTHFDSVIAFNRTSCALSNFPEEHELSKAYTETILRDIAAAWQEFSLAANALLLSKTEVPQ